MAIQIGTADADDEVVSTINTTPLVDVMLVLLIIFLITIPVAIQTVPLDLPQARNQPLQTRPENIVIAVDRDGRAYWNTQPLAGRAELLARLKAEAMRVPQPEVHIRGDRRVRYQAVGEVVTACQRAGIAKVGFITEPPPKG